MFQDDEQGAASYLRPKTLFMKHILFSFLLLFAAARPHAQQLPAPVNAGHKLSIGFNKNVELLGFAYFIAFEGTNSETKMVDVDGKSIPEKDWQTYGYWFYQKYRSHQNNKHLIEALTITEHLWLSNIIPLLLSVPNFPHAQLTPGLNVNLYLAFSKKKNADEARKNTEQFLAACNQFYTDVNFDNFLQATATYYQFAIKQVAQKLPSSVFIEHMEKFYRKGFKRYELIPSLTIPKGMGFSAQYGTTSCNVFGAVGKQAFQDVKTPDMGLGLPDKLRELSIHEFGHAFVNCYIDSLSASLINESAALFTPIKGRMEEQAYNNWRACIAEHIVRAGEIVIAERMGNHQSVTALKKDYIGYRKFIYIPVIMEELNKYAANKEDDFKSTVARIMNRLKEML